MIIKASQRGGAQCLARHLLNANDNEHVEVHEVSGFVTESIPGALQEAYAISRGTRCRQFLFSVSLSPPQGEQVPIETFEETVKQIEARLGLEGQPRLIVFHEKNARRHAHAVWSRIDSDNMKAIHLPFFKNKLMEISKEMYLERNWKLPKGFISRENRNPLNFTQEQWQQAKRLGDNPKQIKTALKECWSASATKDAFRRALERNGYYLAQGDRRGFVAVDWRGEVYSLSRWLDTKGKDLKARLGEEKGLPSVDETKANIDRQLAESMKKHLAILQEAYQKKLAPLLAEKAAMTQRHRSERARLADQHSKRCDREQQERQDRYRKGFMGLWDHLTGRTEKIKHQNEMDQFQAHKRDEAERDQLVWSHLQERTHLQRGMSFVYEEREQKEKMLKEAVFANLQEDRQISLQQIFQEHSTKHAPDFGPEM